MAENRGTYISRFVLGILIGAVGALLLAPKAGKETRRQIRESADDFFEDGRERMLEQGKRALELIASQKDAASRRIDDLKKRIKQIKEQVSRASEEEKAAALKEAQELEEQVKELSK